MSQSNSYSPQADQNRRTRAAESLPSNGTEPRKRQSGRDYLPEQAKPDPRGRDIDIDRISGILGGVDSDGPSTPQDDRQSVNRKRDRASDNVPGDESAGRGDDADETSRKPRPALELDDDLASDEDEANIKRKRGKATPKAIADFAEELELDPKEIYGLQVPGSAEDGEEPLTIGAMKDKLAEVRALQAKADEFEDSRSTAMNEIFVARQQIDDVLQRIRQAIPAQKFAEIFSEVSESEQHQLATARRQVREFFPEWNDAAVMRRDREKLTEHLGSYGFSGIEVDTLRDARLIKYAMDAMRLLERYQRIKAAKKDEPPTRQAPSTRKPPRQNVDQTAKKLADEGDVLGAVSTLLR